MSYNAEGQQEVVIALSGIGKRFYLKRGRSVFPQKNVENTLWALKNISIHVQKGECVGVIGSNGAGKSTLFKIISRITEPTEGQGWVRGNIANMLEVQGAYDMQLSARENVYLHGALLRASATEIDQAFDDIIDFAELNAFKDVTLKSFSSGMVARLSLSIALHLCPDIFLVDEMLSVGDKHFREKCYKKIHILIKKGHTVLLASHNMEMVRAVCSRCICLKNGAIERDTTDIDAAIDWYDTCKA